jgi:hypothetical protein
MRWRRIVSGTTLRIPILPTNIASNPIRLSLLLLGMLFSADAAYADARADVQRAFGQVLAAGGFRGYAQGRMFGPAAPVVSGEIDVVLPDRIAASTDNLEFIAIGDRAWISTLGVWAAVDRSLVPVTAFDVAAMRKSVDSIRDVVLEGTAKTQQCDAHVYRFRANGNLPGAPANGDLRAWICDANGRPARLDATDARTRERVVFDFDWTRHPVVRAPDR